MSSRVYQSKNLLMIIRLFFQGILLCFILIRLTHSSHHDTDAMIEEFKNASTYWKEIEPTFMDDYDHSQYFNIKINQALFSQTPVFRTGLSRDATWVEIDSIFTEVIEFDTFLKSSSLIGRELEKQLTRRPESSLLTRSLIQVKLSISSKYS